MKSSVLSGGAGKARIELPDAVFPIEKFERVLDPLYIRAVILAGGHKMAFISVEMTSLRPYALDQLRSKAADFLKIPTEQVWVGVTHTFSAPHTRSEEALAGGDKALRQKNEILCTALCRALLAALSSAQASLQEVRLRFGTASCPANVNRDQELAEGWWLGADPDGFSDHVVRSLCIDNLEGRLIAVLFSYDVQSSILDGAGGVISGDLAGRASTYIEEKGCDAALFFLGGAGDQTPNTGNEKEKMDIAERIAAKEKLGCLLGEALQEAVSHAEEIVASSNLQCDTHIAVCPGQVLPKNMRDLKPTRSWQYEKTEDRNTEFSLMTLGDLALAAVKPELCSSTSHQIRSRSPYPYTMVFTMVNGAEKYMADARSYERNTYEAMNSMYGKGAAELLEEAVCSILQEYR